MDEAGSTARSLTARARILVGLGRHQEAVEVLARALSSDPTTPDAHVLMAACLLELGRPKDALPHAEMAVSLEPVEASPQLILSATLLTLRRRTRALRTAQEAVRLSPEGARGHIQVAEVLLAMRRRRAARNAAERAVRLEPDSPEAYDALGRVALAQNKSRAAEAAFRKALELDAESPASLNNLGVAAQQEGRLREAVNLFASSVRSDPRDATPANNIIALSNTFPRMLYVGISLLLFGALLRAIDASRSHSSWWALGVPAAIGAWVLITKRWRVEKRKLRPRLLEFSTGVRGTLIAIVVCGVLAAAAALVGEAQYMIRVVAIVGIFYLTSMGPGREIVPTGREPVPAGAFRQRTLRRGLMLATFSLLALGSSIAGLGFGVIGDIRGGETSLASVVAAILLTLLGLLGWAGLRHAFAQMRRADADLTPIPEIPRKRYSR